MDQPPPPETEQNPAPMRSGIGERGECPLTGTPAELATRAPERALTYLDTIKAIPRRNRGLVVAFVLVGALSSAVVGAMEWAGWLGGFWSIIEPLLGIGTLAMAGLIWVGEETERFAAELPLRLTVRFKLGDQDLMVCEEAFLAAESDIRQWGMQIGSQMAAKMLGRSGGVMLDLHPVPQFDRRVLVGGRGEARWLYTAVFELAKEPDGWPPGETVLWNRANRWGRDWVRPTAGPT